MMKKILKGQSLYELVFALAVSALVISAVVSLAAVSVRNSAFARNKTLANRYLQETSEWLREQRDQDWPAFSGHASTGGSEYCLKSLSTGFSDHPGNCLDGETIGSGSTIFYRTVTLTSDNAADPTTVTVEIMISWTDSAGVHDAKTVAEFTNWKRS